MTTQTSDSVTVARSSLRWVLEEATDEAFPDHRNCHAPCPWGELWDALAESGGTDA